MNQSPYNQFNYDQSSKNYEPPSLFERIVGSDMVDKLRNPIYAVLSLLVIGGGFAAVILASYPSDQDDADVPIVQAQAEIYKETPDNPGGMQVAFQDSTLFNSLSGTDVTESAPVENLLADEAPVEDRIQSVDAYGLGAPQQVASVDPSTLRTSLINEAAGVDTGAGNGDDILQKIQEPVKPSAAPQETSASPQTIAFVKDVLEQKDTSTDTSNVLAQASIDESVAAAIEPAAGFAITPGTHYIQLGSVKNAAGAAGEWGKIQKKYPAELSSVKYRVQRADLGERGVFYRIQAGPMSGESAGEICGAIKAENPGACLVTK